LFTEQWRQNGGGMPPLFQKKKKKKKLFSEQWTEFGRAESSNLLLSISLHLARNKLGDPCTVNGFFFLTKHLLSAFLKKRNLYLVAKRALRIPQINIVTTLLY